MLTDIKETIVKEDLRAIFCCIKQSSLNLINNKKEILHYYFIEAALSDIFTGRFSVKLF